MHAVSYSEAREDLDAMIDKVVADRAPIAITRHRREGAVLISASEWASIEETLYLLRSPKNAERLLEAVRGFESGEGGVPFPCRSRSGRRRGMTTAIGRSKMRRRSIRSTR